MKYIIKRKQGKHTNLYWTGEEWSIYFNRVKVFETYEEMKGEYFKISDYLLAVYCSYSWEKRKLFG